MTNLSRTGRIIDNIAHTFFSHQCDYVISKLNACVLSPLIKSYFIEQRYIDIPGMFKKKKDESLFLVVALFLQIGKRCTIEES